MHKRAILTVWVQKLSSDKRSSLRVFVPSVGPRPQRYLISVVRR